MKALHLLCACALLSPLASYAQTVHYVTTPFDSGAGSFRTVVGQALNGDTIRFQITGTITLLTGPITYDKDLVIQGPGMDQLTLSASDQSKVLTITGHSSRISGLSITHGTAFASDNSGGGLDFVGDTLRLENLRVADCSNTGTASSKDGGGVRITAERVRMTGCLFENNTVSCQDGGSAYGGGASITSDDTMLDDCLFSGNHAYGSTTLGGAAWGRGGGVVVYGQSRFTHCTFDQNIAGASAGFFNGTFFDTYSYGGGLYASQADLDLVDCQFTGNLLTGSAAGDPNWYGAGICAQYSEVRMTACTLSGNETSGNNTQESLSQGGGIYVYDGYLTMEECVLDSNRALDGSGIYQETGSFVPHQGFTLRQCRVMHGEGSADHAAIVTALADRVDLRDVEVSDNNQYSLAIGADTIRVDRCLFSGNHGGASIYNPNTNETHIINTTFTQSASASSALYANSTTFFLINCTMVDDSLSIPGAPRELSLENSTVVMKNNILGETWFHGSNAFGLNGGSVISAGGNVCGDGSLAAYLTQPSDANNTQPGVDAFADHGGFTRTWSLLGNSTCIDRGGVDTLTVDQRGFLRDALSDAGAYEFGSDDPAIVVEGVTPDLVLCVGDLMEVAVTASSGADLNYQWYVSGDPIVGATSAAYSTVADLSSAGDYTCSIWNAADSVVAGPIAVMVEICEGVATTTTDPFRIYPNPTDAARGLMVEASSGTTTLNLHLADMEGRVIFQQALPYTDRLHLPLYGIAAGVYTFTLQWEGGRQSRRVVVR